MTELEMLELIAEYKAIEIQESEELVEDEELEIEMVFSDEDDVMEDNTYNSKEEINNSDSLENVAEEFNTKEVHQKELLVEEDVSRIKDDVEGEPNIEDEKVDEGEPETKIEEESESTNTEEIQNKKPVKDIFDYTSFTPYKPSYDDIELNNNMFTMDSDMGIKYEINSSNEKIEKYQIKKNNSKARISADGRYKIEDTYVISKGKIEIPFLKIITALFCAIALGMFVTEFVYNYENVIFFKYLCDLLFCSTAFSAFMTAISSNKNVTTSLKGISIFVMLGMDFIFNGVAAYQDGVFKILKQEQPHDFEFGICILAMYLFLYVFYILCGVKALVSNRAIVTKIAAAFGVISVVFTSLVIYFEQLSGTLQVYYDIVPEYLPIIMLTIGLSLSNFLDKDR
ncbi:MAG: hypothetical protein GX225_06825 [Clostridiales bacterium]|nr:hypothetical protein [Clostridiales bacterium]